MTPEKILALIKVLYQMFLRDIIVKHVESTANPFDDLLLKMLDSVFGISGKVTPAYEEKINPES